MRQDSLRSGLAATRVGLPGFCHRNAWFETGSRPTPEKIPDAEAAPGIFCSCMVSAQKVKTAWA